jgi:hypothetical protein
MISIAVVYARNIYICPLLIAKAVTNIAVFLILTTVVA